MTHDDGIGCEACFGGTAKQAWQARRGFTRTAALIDEVHFIVSLLACPRCGQAFLSIFAERIDWRGGEDPQEWVISPLTPAEAAGLAARTDVTESDLAALGLTRRHLRVWHASDQPLQLAWSLGWPGLPPHD